MNLVTEQSGYLLLGVFGLAMIGITYAFARWRCVDTRDGFLVANRNVNWILGGASIAASWIWAPALFVSVQMAYQKGLWVTDVSKTKAGAPAVKAARLAMLGISLAGLAVAVAIQFIPGIGLKQLWWVFNAIAACVALPTVLSLYWDGLNERGVFWGVVISFCLGLPLFVWANVIEQPAYIVASSLFIVLTSASFCVMLRDPLPQLQPSAVPVEAQSM
jgi:Na+/proline symporter